jgi:hydrophobe/amphiphile efflux-1 (HAE1) family protein
MSVSAPFIQRPIATSLLAAAILIAGVAAYTQLPVAPLPRVDFPTISVNTGLPGASPETMAAARDVQAAINAAGGDLPANLPTRPRFGKVNPADAPILILSLRSDTLPLAQVFEAANAILAQKVAQVAGVGQVFVGGGQQPAVRVQVDPEALAGLGLTLEDVRTVLSQNTVDQAKGSLNGPAQMQSIVANDQLLNADGFRPLVLAYRDGAAVRLGDVAKVFDDVENERVAGWIDGRRSVLMIIRRQPGANILDVIERVKALLPSLARSVSPAIDVRFALDRSQTIRASVADVQLSLVLSVVLVVLVVFVFLRSFWATIVPTVAVPLSLIATFGAMYLLGYSLDNLSLMALTISTGFVVDDAIVVTENVSRFIEAGLTPMEAAYKGAKQIGFTIVSITVSLLAVFIPILLMGGSFGRLFREFAVVLAIAVAVSAIISLTLTPMMTSRLLKPEHGKKHGRLYTASERFFEALLRGYARALDWVLRHEKIMLVVTVATVCLTVLLAWIIPKGLFPQQDTGQISGFSDAPQDISFPAMKARQEALNAVIAQEPEVNHFVSFIGGGSAANTGQMNIELKPLGVRKKTADQVIADLRPKLARVEGINLYLQSVQDVRLGGRSSRTQYQYTLVDADLAELSQWAPRVLAKLQTLPQLRDVATDQQTNGLQLNVDIDRDTAARMGISPQLVDDTLYDAFGQRQVATMYTQLNQYRVVMEVKPEFAAHPDALSKLYVRGTGGPVPLSSFARFSPSSTALSVNHQGQFPAVTLSFNVAPNVSLGQAVDAIHAAELSIGLPGSVHANFQGTAQAFQDSLASEPLLIAFALFAVYIVLGVLYESYVHPITILSTLPSAGVGALLALMAFHLDLSIIALIAIILLIGIVKKNAIMMIDFALEAEREEGLSTRESIRKACLLRFRPIMMTTLAALLGGLPLALGHGVGSELRRPLGIAIVGGLLFSQMLTLFTTPVVYLALDRFSRHRRTSAAPAAPASAA